MPASCLLTKPFCSVTWMGNWSTAASSSSKLEHGSIEQFYRNVDTVGAGDDFKARIDVVDVEETLAVVRVLEEKWGGRIDFTDYLLLMKMDGEWRCVAKAYNQNSDTIQK